MSRIQDLREANQAGYYFLLDGLHRLGMMPERHGPIKIADRGKARAFIRGVRRRLDELDQICMEQEQEEQP